MVRWPDGCRSYGLHRVLYRNVQINKAILTASSDAGRNRVLSCLPCLSRRGTVYKKNVESRETGSESTQNLQSNSGRRAVERINQNAWSSRRWRGGVSFFVTTWLLTTGLANSVAQEPETIEELLARRETLLSTGPQPSFARVGGDYSIELSDAESDRIAKHFRELHPLVSIRNRLAYEESLDEQRRPPELAQQTDVRLNLRERPSSLTREHSLVAVEKRRTQTLSILHSDTVRDFITRTGFGFQRVPPLPLKDLVLGEVELVPFERPKLKDSSEFGNPVDLLPAFAPLVFSDPSRMKFDRLFDSYDSVSDAEKEEKRERQKKYDHLLELNNRLQLPTLPRLFLIHDDSAAEFAGFRRNGFVKDIDHVSGFLPHAVPGVPRLRVSKSSVGYDWVSRWLGDVDRGEKRVWLVTRMQLVSLLKFPDPAVYKSVHIPNMEELVDAETRPLTTFEADSLKRLTEGEDFVTDARTNRIQMVGALRAQKQCLRCHSVHRGELLGAFSYELMRTDESPPNQNSSLTVK